MRTALATPAVVTLASLLLACGPGGSSTPSDAGMAPDPSYWGLADEECRIFDDGSGRNDYTLAINTDSVTVGGLTTWQMLYRTNGFETHTDWLGVTGDSLQMYRQHIQATSGTTGSSDTYISYAPAPDWMVANLMVNAQAHVTSTTATVMGAMTTTEMLQFTLNVAEIDNLMWQGQSVAAPQELITTSGGPSTTTQTIWFAPNVGIMQIGQSTGSNLVLTQILSNVPATSCVPGAVSGS